MKKIVLFLMLCVLSSTGYCQEVSTFKQGTNCPLIVPDARKDELYFGKPKVVKTTRYSLMDVFGEYKIRQTLETHTTYYDTHGYSTRYVSKYGNGYSTITYDKQGRVKQTLTRYGKSTVRCQFFYATAGAKMIRRATSNGRTSENDLTFEKQDGKILVKEWEEKYIEYTLDGHVLKDNRSGVWGGYYLDRYYYNENGALFYQTTDDEEPSDKYVNYKYDKKGNWISRDEAYSKSGECHARQVRTITYY